MVANDCHKTSNKFGTLTIEGTQFLAVSDPSHLCQCDRQRPISRLLSFLPLQRAIVKLHRLALVLLYWNKKYMNHAPDKAASIHAQKNHIISVHSQVKCIS